MIFAAALVVFLGSAATLCSVLDARAFALRGYVDATQDANLPFRVPLLGVNAELLHYPADVLATHLADMQAAGITWVRQFVRWDEVEPEQGVYNWERWDILANALAQRPDLQLVAVLMNTPDWARAAGAEDNPVAPPIRPEDFAAFARAFATRYGHVVSVYQIWDEPNLTAAWGFREPRAADYAALLQAAYPAVHGADEGALVLAAALAPTTEEGPLNISDVLYLRALYALGANAYWDGAAAKPYGFDASPLDRTVDPRVLNFSRAVLLREVMVAHGDGKKALWLSNWGWNSLPDDWTGTPSIWGSVTADAQVDYTLAALGRVEREWTWAGGMLLYHWQPDAPPDSPLWGFALRDAQGQPTALYLALLARARQQAAATDGLYAAANPFTRYSGVWTFGAQGADIGWVRPTDSRFVFTFAGTDVALLLRQDNYTAYLYPTVDDLPANAAPHDPDGRAYIVLTSGTLLPEINLVPAARRLAPGVHRLEVVADRGEDRWALAGFAVSSGNLALPYQNQLLVAGLTTLVAGSAVVVSAVRMRWQPLGSALQALWQRLADSGQLLLGGAASFALMLGMLLTWGDVLPAIFRREALPALAALGSAGLLFMEPGFILTALSAAVLFIIIYNRIDLGLALVMVWAPFFLFPVELYRFAFPVAELLLLLTAGAWLLRQFVAWARAYRSGKPHAPWTLTRWTALDWGIAAWLALGIVSLLWAEQRDKAVTELRVMFVEPVLFYVILRSQLPGKALLLRLVDALLLGGLLVAIIGLFQYVRGEAIITAEEGARRLASVYGSPNNVGLFLGRCVPFALAFLLLPTDRRRRATAGVLLAVMGVAVVLTQSVGALFIGIPAGIAAVLLMVWGRRAWVGLLALAGTAAAAFPFLLQFERFARVLDFSSGTNFYRIRVWQSAARMIADHPLTGIGLDQFLYAFRGKYIIPDAWQEPNLSHPHNIVLDFWLRLGVLGVLLLAWMQYHYWRLVYGLVRYYQTRDLLLYALLVGAAGCMVNIIAHGMIDNSVFVHDLVYVFMLLSGIAAQSENMRAIDAQTERVV